jgi:hypothetical protein
MRLRTENYLTQKERWPKAGRHILAQFDDESVVVYQAYRPAIGDFAAGHGYFGGEFSLNRMSWIKSNFLWMMYRSGWGNKQGQEVVLAIRITRQAFDQILAAAVHSSFVSEVYGTQQEWKAQLQNSEVRLQWDPDHAPNGAKEERRAIQLGLRGSTLAHYSRDWILDIEDISAYVAEQRSFVDQRERLVTPSEKVYPVADPATHERLGLSTQI